MSLALRIAWRHLRSERSPRWLGALRLVAGALAMLGALAIAWSSGHPTPLPGEGVTTPVLVGLGGGVALGLGLLVLGFVALVRRFTLLVAITVYSVAQGCAALIVVLSLLGGLSADLEKRLLGHQAHVRISPPGGHEIVDPEPLVEAVRALPEVAGVSPALEGPVMVRSGFARAGVSLVGVDPVRHAEASSLPAELIEGDYGDFVDPTRLRTRPFPGAAPTEPEPPTEDEPGPADSADPTGPKGQPAPIDEDDASGGWEDPAQEIPRLRAAGRIPPAQAPIAAPPAEDEEDGGGWEDPEQEIPRLRAAGQIPPARAPVVAEVEPDEPAEAPSAPIADESPAIIPVVLGVELAAELSVGVGDPVQLITPEGRITPAGLVPGVLPARVAGVFATGVYQDDHNFAFVPLPAAQAFLRAPDAVTSIAVRLRRPDDLDAGHAAVAAITDAPLMVEDWRQIHRGLFSAIFLEKVAMTVALLFVVLVAAFGILATNLMSVLERSAEIAILKAMGSRDRLVARVFALEGIIVGVLGSVGGIAAGLALCAWFGERGIPLAGAAFTLEALPLHVDPREVALVAVAANVLVGLASVLPARAAAALRPVDGLRRLD